MSRHPTLLCLATLALCSCVAACQPNDDSNAGSNPGADSSAAASAGAGGRLEVGSPEIQAARIRPGFDTLLLTRARGGEEQPVGELTLRTTLAGAVIVRGEQTRGRRGDVVDADSFTLLRSSLAPVQQRSTRGTRGQTLRFDGRRVRGSRTTGGAATPIEIDLAAPAFYGNSVDLVLSALPLREGYSARFPVLSVESGDVVEVQARVAGAEAVRTADGGACRTWRVEVAGGNTNGTYWIERSGRGLVRFASRDGELRMLRKSGCGMP